MLKQALNIALRLCLSLLVVTLSAGVTLYIHHCACSKSVSASFYVAHGCAMPSYKSYESCGEGTCGLHEAVSESSCGCTNDVLIAQVDEVVQSTVIVIKNTPVNIEPQFQDPNNALNIAANQFIPSRNLSCKGDPPPKVVTGRARVILFHRQKSADDLSWFYTI